MLRFGWVTFAVALVATSVVFAADTLAPSEIQATFFTGQAFTARTLCSGPGSLNRFSASLSGVSAGG
jgi:hypothetical protein